MPKVLLVEDDTNLREIFQMRLQADGYTTLAAADGEEGLVVAMKEKPDLIVADIMMPKLSGFEMVESLRAAPEMKNTKVVMMTALGQAEDHARGEKLGVVKYLVKSQVTLEDFARVVNEVLGHAPQQNSTTGNEVKSSTNNKQESEKNMQEDQAPTNPMPTGDGAGSSVPSTNPSGAGADMPASDGQQTSSQEEGVVKDHINDFVSGAPAPSAPTAPAMPAAEPPAPAGGSDMPAPMPPAAEPPAAPADMPASGDQPAAPPSDPMSNAL